MLRLIQDPDPSQPSAPRRRPTPLDPLTTDERRHVQQALRNLRLRLGGWDVVAAVTGASQKTLSNAASRRGRPSTALALRAARAAGVPLEALLAGSIRSVGSCATCGAKSYPTGPMVKAGAR